VLHGELRQQACKTEIHIWIAGFCEYSQIRGAPKLAPRIGLRHADALELEHVEFVKETQSFEPELDHAFPKIKLLGCAVASRVDDNL
jgi:hypothetical protein